jgi:MSHA pilin protein MshA
MNNQKGFTLIELVVVIVILGILSAVAVPKFVDMQTEAKQAALEGARGSVKSAVNLVHAKWLVGGQTSPVDVEGDNIAVDAFGYPTLASIVDAAGIGDDFTSSNTTAASGGVTTIHRSSDTLEDGTWSFTYTQATITDGALTAPPTVGVVKKYTAPWWIAL